MTNHRQQRLLLWCTALSLLSCGGEPRRATPAPSPTEVRSTPPSKAKPKLVQIASGEQSTCGVADDGSVWCWGRRIRSASDVPVRIEGLDNAVEVAIGVGFRCARLDTGHIRCWGGGPAVGLARSYIRPDFWSVPEIDDAVEIAAGLEGACARRKRGRVTCWGLYGRVGSAHFRPEQLHHIALPGEAKKLSGGWLSYCALVDKALWCWKKHKPKAKSIGARAYVDMAVSVKDGLCAITEEGSVECFGRSCHPRDYEWRNPCEVGIAEGATEVVAGQHNCAKSSGQWKCWGNNASGQITPKGEREFYAAQPLPFDTHGVVSMAPGATHTCALDQSGEVTCWGSDYLGELGRGPAAWVGHRYVLDAKSPTPDGFDLGDNHACVIAKPAPRCWGAFEDGPKAMRRGPLEGNLVPAAAGATRLASGWRETCAARPGAVICWGDAFRPQPRVSTTQTMVALDNAKGFRCGITEESRELWCWGWHSDFPLPEDAPKTTATDDPARLDGASPVVAMATGLNDVCWSREDGKLLCRGKWVRDAQGESRRAPKVPLEIGTYPGIEAIAAGKDFACILIGGEVSCWGSNRTGELGNGSWTHPGGMSKVIIPVAVQAIEASERHVCAVGTDGSVWCWGENRYAELGTGDRVAKNRATRVLGVDNAIAVKVDDSGSCAILEDGEVICWGDLPRTLFHTRAINDAILPKVAIGIGEKRPSVSLLRVPQRQP